MPNGIHGHLISGATRRPLPKLRVEAWDRELVFRDCLGSAVSDAEGSFTIEFRKREYREILERHPDIYFKVFRDKQLVADTRAQVLWNVTQPDVPVMIPVSDGDSTPTERHEPFRVEGSVTTEDGRAVSDVIVEVWDQRLGAEKLLATGATDAKGHYVVHYDSEALDGKERADLVVRVRDPRRQRAELARTGVFYRAKPAAVADVPVRASEVARPSEYDRLRTAIAPLLGNTRLADLDANGVIYAANRSGWDARMVAMAAEAERLSGVTRIPAPHYYALMRAGVDSDTTSIHALPDASVQRAFEMAIASGVISREHSVNETLKLYGERRIGALQHFAPAAAMSKLGDMLDLSLNQVQKQRFLEVYQATAGQPVKLWSELAQAGFDSALIERLKTDGKLGFITRQNAPLIARLRATAGISRVEDLTRAGLYKAEAWEPLIGNDVPPQLSRPAYAVGLAAQVNLAYPTLVVAEMVRRRDLAIDPLGEEGEGEVAAFLRASHGRHTLGREPIKSWEGFEQLSPGGRDGARLVERLYQLSPSNESMVALSNLGLHSAYQITREPKELFLRKYGAAFPTHTEAMLVYQKAQEVHSTALNLATMYLVSRSAPNVYALSGSIARTTPEFVAAHGAPTLEELFQNMDYCACEHCKSVLSPAAYFVDLLHFIDVPEVPEPKRNPLDVLFDRRPDLENLLLSCENTNVALPYIDIVNEILEHFALHRNLNSFKGHNMREDSNTADLLADPEFVESAAYDYTNAEVYPHNLPFDMPLEALRLFMQSWGTTLAEALRILSTPAAARLETLGLNAGEYRILTDIAFRKLPEYFGEPADATIDALNEAVADGKTFCRRTNIEYEHLVALLKTRFVNPGAPLVAMVDALGVSLATLHSWYEGSISDEDLITQLSSTVDPADYGGDILRWLHGNESLIMERITLTDVSVDSVECNFATVELRFALPDANANRLTPIAYHKLLRFIRLWKKLGWSIDFTDRLVTSFLGVSSQDLSVANIDDAFVALIARIGNFAWLMRRVSEKSKGERLSGIEKKASEWLRVWDTSDGSGARLDRLAHLLCIGSTDIRAFCEITGIQPLAADLHQDLPSVHRFVDAWLALKAVKLKVADVDYVLRNRDDAGKIAPTEAALMRDIKALRDGLLAVDADLSAPAETADMPYALSKMALVYDATVVGWFAGLVSGSGTYDAPFATMEDVLPAKLTAADHRLGFNPFRKVLTYTGVMTASSLATLADTANTLVLADMTVITAQPDLDAFVAGFKSALQAVADAGAGDVQQLAAEYPELKSVYDAVVAERDPAMQAAVLVDKILPELRGRLKTIALRSVLASSLKTSRPLVDVMTADTTVLHASSDPSNAVLDDFRALENSIEFAESRAHAFHIDPPATDDYTLYVAAPAGTTVTLAIGGVEVIPAAVIDARGEVSTAASVRLQAGALTAVTLTLAALPVGTSAELRWRTKALAKASVPRARIYADEPLAKARVSVIRLQKAALLLRAVPLTPRELKHLAAVNPDTANYLNELDVGGTIQPAALHALWAKLAWVSWFSVLKADEPSEDTWVSLLEDPSQRTPRGPLALAGTNNWKEQDLLDTLAHFGLSIADVSSLHAFRRVKEAVDYITATGQPAAEFLSWAVDAPVFALIASIKDILRAGQDTLSWRTTLRSVNDALRNKRRDALVSYILYHAAPSPNIDTAEKLYEHFLIDVEMDACRQTSRIRQALSTTQLFVTRCLMNLEPDVAPSSIRADQWTWMKRYRVWEANRKVFLYPENWLEPELRDDKSPFFRELESELLKADITDELAEGAYLSYLKKLDEVARLEIVASYLEERSANSQDEDILHLFGRTNGTARQHYYRRFENGHFTPWENVTLNIEGDLLFPVVWKSQLFVFWLTAIPKPEGGNLQQTPTDTSGKNWDHSAKISVELHLGWGEYYRGKWTSPKSSELNDPIRLEELANFEPNKVFVLARTTDKATDGDSERLVMLVGYVDPLHLFRVHFASKNRPPVIRKERFDSLMELLSFNYLLFRQLQPPAALLESNRCLRVVDGRTVTVTISQPSGLLSFMDETLLSKSEKLYGGFRLRPTMHRVRNQWKAPVFYSDEHAVFSMTPDERVESHRQYDGYFWNEAPVVVIPADKVKIPPLYEAPVITDPKEPLINPLVRFVNPNYERAISNNDVFVYRGTALDAGGTIAEEIQR